MWQVGRAAFAPPNAATAARPVDREADGAAGVDAVERRHARVEEHPRGLQEHGLAHEARIASAAARARCVAELVDEREVAAAVADRIDGLALRRSPNVASMTSG